MPAVDLGRKLASVGETDQQLGWKHRGEKGRSMLESVCEGRLVPRGPTGTTVFTGAGTRSVWPPGAVLKDRQDEV